MCAATNPNVVVLVSTKDKDVGSHNLQCIAGMLDRSGTVQPLIIMLAKPASN